MKIPNDFAAAYKAWAVLYEPRINGLGDQEYNVQEERAWKEVENQFGKLKKFMRAQYQ